MKGQELMKRPDLRAHTNANVSLFAHCAALVVALLCAYYSVRLGQWGP